MYSRSFVDEALSCQTQDMIDRPANSDLDVVLRDILILSYHTTDHGQEIELVTSRESSPFRCFLSSLISFLKPCPPSSPFHVISFDGKHVPRQRRLCSRRNDDQDCFLPMLSGRDVHTRYLLQVKAHIKPNAWVREEGPQDDSTALTCHTEEVETKDLWSWRIRVRYSDFCRLEQKFVARFGPRSKENGSFPFPLDCVPPLPPKTWFRRLDPAFLEERTARLQEYISAVQDTPPAVHLYEEVQEFFQLRKGWERDGSWIEKYPESGISRDNLARADSGMSDAGTEAEEKVEEGQRCAVSGPTYKDKGQGSLNVLDDKCDMADVSVMRWEEEFRSKNVPQQHWLKERIHALPYNDVKNECNNVIGLSDDPWNSGSPSRWAVEAILPSPKSIDVLGEESAKELGTRRRAVSLPQVDVGRLGLAIETISLSVQNSPISKSTRRVEDEIFLAFQTSVS